MPNCLLIISFPNPLCETRDWPTNWPSASEKFLIHVIFSSSTGKLAKFDEIMGKISAVFLARKKRSITFIVNYELRLSLYSNRVKGRGWNIYKFLVERKPAKIILWRHLKWRWKERKDRQETWLQLRPWDAITCNNTWRGKRSYGVNTFPDAKKEPNFFKKK